jgi:signal transduction histidine kinase
MSVRNKAHDVQRMAAAEPTGTLTATGTSVVAKERLLWPVEPTESNDVAATNMDSVSPLHPFGLGKLETLAAVAAGGTVVSAFLLGASTADLALRPVVVAAIAGLFAAFLVILALAVMRLRTALASTSEAQASLQAELERRERFWSSAAHDVKSHVAAIGLRAQILKNKAPQQPGAASEATVRGLDEIRATSSRISTIITELQDVARLHMGAALSLDLQRADLVALADTAVSEARLNTNQRRQITFDARVPELVGCWDVVRIGRVLDNLLDNAIKYSREDTEIVVSVDDKCEQGGGWAALTIKDQGIGIPERELPHIFERFHRASNVRARIPGTGLGLAGAQEILEQHGGSITVSSQEGVGSSFTIRLPLGQHEGGEIDQ